VLYKFQKKANLRLYDDMRLRVYDLGKVAQYIKIMKLRNYMFLTIFTLKIANLALKFPFIITLSAQSQYKL